MSLLLLLTISYYFGIVLSVDKKSRHSVSCIGLENGLHYIRPNIFIENEEMDRDKFPSILVRCFNGWAIFDYSLDPHITNYFTSFMPITDDFASMDVGFEHINWNDWLQIKHTKLSISQDCSTCSLSDNDQNDIGYYMTGNYYGCSFATKALCDMDPNTLQCNKCKIPSLIDDDTEYPGLCTHIPLNINNIDINSQETSHQKCVTYKWNYLPSIGLNGKFCPCLKPKKPDKNMEEMEAEALYPNPIDNNRNGYHYNEAKREEDNIINCQDRIIEIKNDDFKHGTYRIRSCGTYKLMENIELNMNAPIIGQDKDIDFGFNEYLSPNNENNWWPTKEQMKNRDEYPSNNFIGAYAMGFFAGISIESDDVIIDLNRFKLSMHYDFYIQQRFFSLIEMGSKPFISGQGPANFGNVDVVYPNNIIIKNGILGLTSHHCIHGNNNKNVKIFDIEMIDFEVSGISINGFDQLFIEDIDIGPNYQNIPITPQYAHGRFMLQRMSLIPDLDNAQIIINNKKIKAIDIIDTLKQEMDNAFLFSYNKDEISVDDEIFNNLFVNLDGLPHGGTLYGMFFNSQGASVFGLGLSPGFSKGLTLRNINIHQLRSNPIETVRGQLQRGPFNDLLDMDRIIDNNMKYKPTSYSNAQYTLSKLIPDTWWSILGHTFISKQVDKWISENKKLKHMHFKCNADIMLHLTKGIFGIRIDNVNDIIIDGYLNIENIHNLGQFGNSKLCGKYSSSKNGGHHNQEYPQQIGYTGNEVHGITIIGSQGKINANSNIYINDLISARGSSFGINFYGNNDFKIEENTIMVLNNIHAGAYLTDLQFNDKFGDNILPNTPPRSCVIDIWTNNNNIIDINHNANIKSHCITGYDSCSFKYSQIDDKYTINNDILNKDYMENLIDNDYCDKYQFDQQDQTVLDGLSQTSIYHAKTIDLLRLQPKQINIDKITKHNIRNKTKGGNHIYLLMTMLCANFILLIGYLLYSRYENEKKLKNNDNMDNERKPLIPRKKNI